MHSISFSSLQVLVRSLLIVSSFVLAAVIPQFLYAQDEVGVKMQPTLIEEQLNPGEVLGGVVTITNVSGFTQTYKLLARDVAGVDELGRPQFINVPDESGAMLSSWVTLSQESLVVGPNESVKVSYEVRVPEDASPGGHFGGIFIDREAEPTTESGAGIGFQVGSLIGIQVNGDIVEGLRIREFSADQGLFVTPDVTFKTKITNTGTVLQRPRGIVKVTDMLGKEVVTLDVNANGGAALPQADRSYDVEWNGEGLHFGRYDAVLSMVYGQNQRSTISREISFWIVPVKLLGTILGVLLGAVVLFYIFIKFYVRRELKRAGVSAGKKAKRGKTFGERLATVMIVILTITILLLIALFLFFA